MLAAYLEGRREAASSLQMPLIGLGVLPRPWNVHLQHARGGGTGAAANPGRSRSPNDDARKMAGLALVNLLHARDAYCESTLPDIRARCARWITLSRRIRLALHQAGTAFDSVVSSEPPIEGCRYDGLRVRASIFLGESGP